MGKYANDQEKWREQKRAQRERLKENSQGSSSQGQSDEDREAKQHRRDFGF